VKIGDDGDEIDLDLTLEKNLFDAANLKVGDILTDGAFSWGLSAFD